MINSYLTLAAFVVALISSTGLVIVTIKQLALSKKIRQEAQIVRSAAPLTNIIPKMPSSIDDVDIAAKVNQQVNAMYYKRQLTAVRKSLEKNGFRCVLDSGQDKNISHSDIPYFIRVEAADAIIRERYAQLYPNGSSEAQTKFISENIKDGYALVLLDEIFDALAGLGFVVIEDQADNGNI